jgi:hypothetical protein
MRDSWSHELCVRGSVSTQRTSRFRDRALKESRVAILERMRKCHGRVDPLQTMLGQRERTKEGGGNG